MRYVVDTHAVIWHFPKAFGQMSGNSEKVGRILRETLVDDLSPNRLVVPSIVFVEIFDKFSRTREESSRVYYECFVPLKECDRIELRELDFEILEAVSQVGGVLDSHEINDKIIVATARVLNSPILTKDPKIHEYADNGGCNVDW